MQPDHERIGRERVSRLFRYISAWNQLGNPPKRLIREQLWFRWFKDFPEHSCVERGTVSPPEPVEGDPDRAMRPVFARLQQLKIEPLGPETAPQSTNGELRDEVTRRAAEIVRAWKAESSEADSGAGQQVPFDLRPPTPTSTTLWS